jgi:hypothetical protein
MFAFLPPGLTPLEVVAASGLCALTALSIAITISCTVAFLATRPRAVRQPAAAPVRKPEPRPQPAGVLPPVVAMGRVAG